MAFEELGIHTMRDAATGLIAISNLFLSQPIPVNDKTISMIEEYMKNTKMENIRKAHFEINNAVDSEVCCSDKKALKNDVTQMKGQCQMILIDKNVENQIKQEIEKLKQINAAMIQQTEQEINKNNLHIFALEQLLERKQSL